jgi:hypothetical protein
MILMRESTEPLAFRGRLFFAEKCRMPDLIQPTDHTGISEICEVEPVGQSLSLPTSGPTGPFSVTPSAGDTPATPPSNMGTPKPPTAAVGERTGASPLKHPFAASEFTADAVKLIWASERCS